MYIAKNGKRKTQSHNLKFKIKDKIDLEIEKLSTQ